MTNRYLPVCAAAALLLCARAGYGQNSNGPVTGGAPSAATAIVSPGNGLQVSDGATLHAGVTVEGGYDSNVFYTNTAVKGSAILRVNPFLDLNNTARNGEVPAGLFFDMRASLGYREYLNSDPNITRLRAFTPSAGVILEHNSNGALVLGFSDNYSRLQDAPYTEVGPNSEIIIRDNNLAIAQLRWSPGGGRLQGLLRFSNTIDWFETSLLKPADSMTNEAMIDLSWRWLPKTALYLQVRQGYVSYLNNDNASGLVVSENGVSNGKYSSYPLRAVVGIRGLITEKTSVAVALGYQNAFYSNGPSTSGFLGSTTAMAELVVLPLFSTKLTFGAHHDFQNSVIGNFFYDDGAYALLSHQSIGRVVAQLSGSYDHRRFYGLPIGEVDPRIDDYVQAIAMADYFLRSWAFAGLSYTLTHNSSNDLNPGAASGANYTKHQIFARLGVTY